MNRLQILQRIDITIDDTHRYRAFLETLWCLRKLVERFDNNIHSVDATLVHICEVLDEIDELTT